MPAGNGLSEFQEAVEAHASTASSRRIRARGIYRARLGASRCSKSPRSKQHSCAVAQREVTRRSHQRCNWAW
jgi:hypothetical protein